MRWRPSPAGGNPALALSSEDAHQGSSLKGPGEAAPPGVTAQGLLPTGLVPCPGTRSVNATAVACLIQVGDVEPVQHR